MKTWRIQVLTDKRLYLPIVPIWGKREKNTSKFFPPVLAPKKNVVFVEIRIIRGDKKIFDFLKYCFFPKI